MATPLSVAVAADFRRARGLNQVSGSVDALSLPVAHVLVHIGHEQLLLAVSDLVRLPTSALRVGISKAQRGKLFCEKSELQMIPAQNASAMP